jgi:hypothetical protein
MLISDSMMISDDIAISDSIEGHFLALEGRGFILNHLIHRKHKILRVCRGIDGRDEVINQKWPTGEQSSFANTTSKPTDQMELHQSVRKSTTE